MIKVTLKHSLSLSMLFCITISFFIAPCVIGISNPEPILPRMPGNTYYISPIGDNSNPGTLAEPWATPGFASRQLQPGDTLIILGGRYILIVYDDDIICPPSGTLSEWITIKGEEGNRPVLTGQNNLMTAVDISNKSYIKLENIEFTSVNCALFRDCIEAYGASTSHIILQNLYIHHIDEYGIDIGDIDDLQIINCTISYCGFGSIGGPAGMLGGWRNVTIKGCVLSHAGWYYQGKYYNCPNGPAVSPYDRPDGFGIEAADGPIEITDTLAIFNLGDGLDSKSNNTYIHECVVSNNRCDGIKLWGTGSRVVNTLIYGRGGGDMESTPWSAIVVHTQQSNATFEFMNVVIDDYIGQNYLMHVQYDSPTIPINLTMRNTIFCARGLNTGIYIAGNVHLVLEFNLFYMPNNSANVVEVGSTIYDSTQLGTLGVGNIYGDPLFVQPAVGSAGDYHVQSESKAIDNGTTTSAPPIDIDGASRPYGAGIDIGAYEYISPGGDSIKPTVIIQSPINDTILVSTTVMVVGIATDNIGVQKVEISKDGINWVYCTGTKLWVGSLTLNEGLNLIYAKVTDISGNYIIINITITVKIENCKGGIPSFNIYNIFAAIALSFILFQLHIRRKQKKSLI
jgi:hypothetical protein